MPRPQLFIKKISREIKNVIWKNNNQQQINEFIKATT
jgi:hypothetical protein